MVSPAAVDGDAINKHLNRNKGKEIKYWNSFHFSNIT